MIKRIMENIVFTLKIEYLQGMVDLVCPFVTIFIHQFSTNASEFIEFLNESNLLERIESNTFWCFYMLLKSLKNGELTTISG